MGFQGAATLRWKILLNGWSFRALVRHCSYSCSLRDTDTESEPIQRSPRVKVEEVDRAIDTAAVRQGDTLQTPIELHIDEDEVKPKPMLRLKYQGFNIVGRCLCVVVEPWPPIRATSVAPLFTRPSTSKSQNMDPPETSGHSIASSLRSQTPLFLPEYDTRATPAPFTVSPLRPSPSLPAFDDKSLQEFDLEQDTLIQFSQAITSGGDLRAGEAYDDDDMDGAVFFADADEAREL
jgi:hypothetical protein